MFVLLFSLLVVSCISLLANFLHKLIFFRLNFWVLFSPVTFCRAPSEEIIWWQFMYHKIGSHISSGAEEVKICHYVVGSDWCSFKNEVEGS